MDSAKSLGPRPTGHDSSLRFSYARTPPHRDYYDDDDDDDACNVTKTERVCRERISRVVQRVREKFPNDKRQSDLLLPTPKSRLTNFNVIIFRPIVNGSFLKIFNFPCFLFYNLKNLYHIFIKKRILVMLLQLRKDKNNRSPLFSHSNDKLKLVLKRQTCLLALYNALVVRYILKYRT